MLWAGARGLAQTEAVERSHVQIAVRVLVRARARAVVVAVVVREVAAGA